MEGTIDTTTPVTTTEAAPAAPATSAPAESSSTSQRPSSMREALEQAAAAEATPAASTETAATEPAANASEDSATHPGTEKKGPVPFDVHHKSIENARVKATAEAQARFDAEYGWAKSITPQQIQEFAGLAQKMTADPVTFLREFAAELQNHPTYGPQLRTEAARTLASGRGAGAMQPPEPDVAIQDANGNVVGKTYSADALAKRDEWLIHQTLSKIDQQYGPIRQGYEQQRQAAEQARADRANLEATVDSALEQADAILESNDEAIAKLGEEVNKIQGRITPQQIRVLALKVRDEHLVASRLRPSVESSVLDSLKKKAGGATAGAGGSTAPLKRPGNASELAALMRQLDGAA